MTGCERDRRSGAGRVGLVVALAVVSLSACKRPDWASEQKNAPASAAAPAAGQPAQTAQAGGPRPAPEPWAQAMLGKNPRELFQKNGVCVGNTDAVVQRYGGAAPGVQIAGWGWDVAKRQRVEHVIFVDENYTVVGWAVGGADRADVPHARPDIPDTKTGWVGVANIASGPVDAYGIVGDGAALCPLGHIEF